MIVSHLVWQPGRRVGVGRQLISILRSRQKSALVVAIGSKQTLVAQVQALAVDEPAGVEGPVASYLAKLVVVPDLLAVSRLPVRGRIVEVLDTLSVKEVDRRE